MAQFLRPTFDVARPLARVPNSGADRPSSVKAVI